MFFCRFTVSFLVFWGLFSQPTFAGSAELDAQVVMQRALALFDNHLEMIENVKTAESQGAFEFLLTCDGQVCEIFIK